MRGSGLSILEVLEEREGLFCTCSWHQNARVSEDLEQRLADAPGACLRAGQAPRRDTMAALRGTYHSRLLIEVWSSLQHGGDGWTGHVQFRGARN